MARRTTPGLVATVGAIVAAIALLGHANAPQGQTGDGSSSAVAPSSVAASPTNPAATTTATTATDPGTPAATGFLSTPSASWTVTEIVDGDTIWVARGGVHRKVRLIGIDTPESGQCGFAEAASNLRRVIAGRPVVLTPGVHDDADRYGRLLRYVDVGGIDAGLDQVRRGYAVARYDSRDGYGHHTREAAYVRADIASPKAPCADPNRSSTAAGSTIVGGAWPLPGDRYPLCPANRPIKGNESSHIAHRPGDRYYNVTKPEECFATMAEAIAAGYRPAKV